MKVLASAALAFLGLLSVTPGQAADLPASVKQAGILRLSVRASRRETMDFVDYLTTGPQFFVLEGSTAKTAADLCGLKVGTVRSTSFPVEIEKWSKANCEAAGKPAAGRL